MKTSILILAAGVALCLVLPRCCARPDVTYEKSQNSQQASASAATSSQSSSEEIRKSGCGGDYSKSSQQRSSQAAASSSSSSQQSYEKQTIGGGASCGCKKELSEDEIKSLYQQTKGEKLEDYFKRIVTKSTYTSTTESYIKILNIVRRDFASLDLWYDRKYINLVKDYYLELYKRQESESYESYYSRIIKKDSWESEIQYAKRVAIIRDIYPTLDLWIDQKYFDKYTKQLYALEFKKFEKETDVEYVKRIFERDSFFDKSDLVWAKRIFLIQEATISSSIWYNEEYFSYFQKFYEVYYKKESSEACDKWLQRALSRLPGESIDNAIKRINFIKKVTRNCGCWEAEYFKKIQEAKCFEEAYISQIQKAFFCSCGGVTVERKSSSQKSAASSSASSSSSESTIIKN